jgi:tetratricopeptide (TPR) repeat protein
LGGIADLCNPSKLLNIESNPMRASKLIITSFCTFLLCMSFTFVNAQGTGLAFFKKAEELRKQKQFSEALIQYRQAISAEPTNYRYLFGEGKCYNSLKDYDNAILSFQRCVENKTDYTNGYVMLANCYKKKNDNANAAYNFDQAFNYESDPTKKVTYKMEMVKLLVKDGKTAEAQDAISEAKSLDPTNLNLLYYEAKLSNDAGDFATARDAMNAALPQLENMPTAQSAKYFYELGFAYYQLGDYTGSQKAWEKAYFGAYKVKIDQIRAKNNPSFFYRMASSYFTAGQYDQAREQVQKALELQNNYSSAYTLLGKIDKKEGNFAQAITNFETAVEMEGDPVKKVKILASMIQLQLDASDFSGALKSCNEVLGTDPANAKVLYSKALAQYELDQYASAISTLENLLAANASADQVTKAKFNFLLGMAAKNTDPEMAKAAFKGALFGPYKAAAKNEYDILVKGGN